MPWNPQRKKGKMNEPIGIGIPIRLFREENNLSQEEMGEKIGLTGSAISRMESGQRTRIEVDTYKRIAQAMGITLDELVARSTSEAATA